MTSSTNKLLSIEEIKFIISGPKGDYTNTERQLAKQLADTVHSLKASKGREETKQIIITQLEHENERIKKWLQYIYTLACSTGDFMAPALFEIREAIKESQDNQSCKHSAFDIF